MGGNRKTSSTKGGKYMNPTDQARKEERKKQLKKHKRQREQVREAVIKSKNPNSVLDELAKLDDLEFDAENECPYADRVMQEKRTRMKATYFKVRRAKKLKTHTKKCGRSWNTTKRRARWTRGKSTKTTSISTSASGKESRACSRPS
jgi:hypothetical protein